MIKSAICISAGIVIASIAYALAAPPSADEKAPPQVYRVLPRLEIDKLGLDGKLPPNHRYDPSLERGLNILAAEGWELVAVEGGRMRTFHGGGAADASLDIHPTYIFRRTSDNHEMHGRSP